MEFYGSMVGVQSPTYQGTASPGLFMYQSSCEMVMGQSTSSYSLGLTNRANGGFVAFGSVPSSQNYLWSYIDTGSSIVAQYNYQASSQASYPCATSGGGGGYSTTALESSVTGSLQAYWIRQRAYPPGGVMPAVSIRPFP
jgi:hypothetical protein